MGQRTTTCPICKGEGEWYCADCQVRKQIHTMARLFVMIPVPTKGSVLACQNVCSYTHSLARRYLPKTMESNRPPA